MDESDGPHLSRRHVVQAAAWAVPVVTLAVALPTAAASAVPGNDGDYRWASPDNAQALTFVPDPGGGRATVSANIIFAGAIPPPGATLHLQLVFSPSVTLLTDPPAPWTRVLPTEMSTPVGVVNYALTPSGQGGSPYIEIEGAGLVTVTGSIYLDNGGGATWSDLAPTSSVHL